MKKLLFIGTIFVFLLGICFKNNVVDFYYSLSNQEEIVFAQKILASIYANDFEKARKLISPESKLLTDGMLLTASNIIHEINLESEKIAKVLMLEDGEFSSIIEVVSIYDNNPIARIRVQLIQEKQSGLLKVKDVFFNDEFFIKTNGVGAESAD